LLHKLSPLNTGLRFSMNAVWPSLMAGSLSVIVGIVIPGWFMILIL
jgi:hypothetical protein